MKAARNLRVVEPAEPPPIEPEVVLAELVPALAEAEAGAASLRRQIDAQRCRLARKRGVAFIRPEHIKREFANGGPGVSRISKRGQPNGE